jgi:AcrR family transcriptional regulator
MGVIERRERERLETRTKIMDAARDLFAREGYEAVSMRRIAEAIEYSATAIYVHFKDKQDLLLEICRADFGAFGHMLAELQAVADPVERIRRMGHAYVRFGVQHPNHYRLMFMTKVDYPKGAVETDANHGNVDADGYALLKLSCQQAIDQGRVRREYADADLLAQAFWAAVHGITSLQITKAKDPWITWVGLEPLAAAVIDAVLRGATVGDALTHPDAAANADAGATGGRP